MRLRWPERLTKWIAAQPKCRFGEPEPSRLFLAFLVLYFRGRWDENLQPGWVVYLERFEWESDPVFPRLWRMLMCGKALICIALNRQDYTDIENERFELGHWGADTYQTMEGTFHEWSFLAVGEGFFANWYFEIAGETT